MAKDTRAQREEEKEPIYTWAFKSSKPRAGGRLINYITQLNQDETLSCNCPGWIFKKKSEIRGCKHTKQVEDEVGSILRAYKSGESLPVLDEGEGQTGFASAPASAGKSGKTKNDTSKIRYGRVIEI